MSLTSQEFSTVEAYRSETVCRGCDKPKQKGLIVCWGCFKHCRDIEPLKYFGGDMHEWLAYARMERKLKA